MKLPSARRLALLPLVVATPVAALAACAEPPAPETPHAAVTAAPAAAAPAPPPVGEVPAAPTCGPGTMPAHGGGCAPLGLPPATTAVAQAPPAPACPEGMALVPGGSFPFGFAKAATTVAPFCMDRTEVTADAYGACVKGGKCTKDFTTCAAQATYGVAGLGDHPIVCVDFAQANAYCAAQGHRLPATAEWEWAARGATEPLADYPWGKGDPKDQVCWSGTTAQTGTCKVGSFPAGDSPQGIHDLVGNVFEWTVGQNDAKSPVRDGRGGSWRDGTAQLMKPGRVGGFAPSYRCGFLGIRCVAPAP